MRGLPEPKGEGDGSEQKGRGHPEGALGSHIRILELIAASAPLQEILEGLVQMLEAHVGQELLGAVMLLDPRSEHLRHAAGSSLPESYVAAVDGSAIGPLAGPFGAAVFSGEPQAVADLFGKAVPPDLRELAELHGFRSCWAAPIVSTKGEALGVLAAYAKTPATVPQDEQLVAIVLRTAAIAIEGSRLEEEREALLARERAARREAEDRARAALSLEYVADGVSLVDGDGVVRLWNPAAERILGIPREAILERRIVDVLEDWRPVADQSPTRGGRAATFTVPLRRQGFELWLAVSAMAFEGGTVYAFRDVTNEQELATLRADIVATVSHELRTPLAAVYGAAKTLERLELGSDEAERLVEVVAGEAERLRILIEEILLASQLESGVRMRFDLEPVDLVPLVREVVGAMEEQAVSIRTELPASPISATADEQRLRQVVANLLDNAVKYAGPHGEITVGVEPAGDSVLLYVRDRGPGVPEAEQKNIFEKFHRLDPGLLQGIRGTGLGLYIVRELVRRMGGRVWVESTAGEGATFFVELPA